MKTVLEHPRKDALNAGLTTYQGKACDYGHGHTRYTCSGACVACTVRRKEIGRALASNARAMAKVHAMQAELQTRMDALARAALQRQKERLALEEEQRQNHAHAVLARRYNIGDL